MPTNKPNKKVFDLGASIKNMMNNLYSNTYMTSPKLGSDMTALTKDIDASLDRISNSNTSAVGVPNISKLYTRANLDTAQGDKTVIKNIEDTFNDANVMDTVIGSYMDNKYLKDLDLEIDTICKYMPRLEEALETRKDNVLSADHFSKDFLTVSNKTVQDNNDTFIDNINQLKEKYDLSNLVEDVYNDASKYGEVFLYVVPYHKALNKLINNKASSTINKVNIEAAGILSESAIQDGFEFNNNDNTNLDNINLSVEICTSNMIESVISNIKSASLKLDSINESSLYYTEAGELDKTINDDLSTEGIKTNRRDIATDGLITKQKQTISDKFPGSIVKRLDRSQVIPVYIEDMCLGYYYIEFKDKAAQELNYSSNSLSDPVVGINNNNKAKSIMSSQNQEKMLRYMSSQLSSVIDSKFINNNQDLRKEIYMILKHNDIFNNNRNMGISVTFVPPDDMIHVAFKLDKDTHRGISDLKRSLIPAKLYACLYITNVLTILTRGQDKRVYYVKNQVDTNISKVLLNTINQIKKSNFGIRQVENINNILNITGRFNDYVIPLSPSGDAPVNFEVMPGQNVDVKTDLMNILEEIAINSTDVPIELIQARQSIDYAMQLTMTNSKFLRKIYNRQAKYQKILSNLITKLYNSEFKTSYELEVTLPPPMFLNITNTNQLITNTKDYVDSSIDYELAGEEDENVKNIYRKDLLEYHLGSHINTAKHREILERARMKAKLMEKSSDNN